MILVFMGILYYLPLNSVILIMVSHDILALWLPMQYAQHVVIKQPTVAGWNRHGLVVHLARHIIRRITWLPLLSGIYVLVFIVFIFFNQVCLCL